MCGIIGCLSKSPNKKIHSSRVSQYIIDQFQDQFKRGREGFGLTEIYEDGWVNILRATTEPKMLMDLYRTEVKHLILHHRNPTSSVNTLDQTHPITIEHDELQFVWNVNHNGTISNKDELREAHLKLGYVYLTEYKETTYAGSTYGLPKFNDTEAFAIELARFLEGKTDNIKARGGYAFIATCSDKKGLIKKIYIGGNGYGTLNLSDTGSMYQFASEERGGVAIPDDTAVRFDAVYSPNEEDKTKQSLTGFEMVKEPIKLLYPVKLIVSPYVGNGWNRSGTGFGKHGQGDPKAPAASPGGKKEEDDEKSIVNFSSYAHIVAHVGRGKLGEVFTNIDWATHEAIERFDLKAFDNFIAQGKVEKAEDVYEAYREDMIGSDESAGGWLDAEDVIEHHLQPIDTKITTSPTIEETIEAYRDASRKRMSAMAKEYLPIFLLASYCECIITLAYQYQTDEAHREEAESKKTPAERLKNLIDAADPDKPLNLPGQEFEEEIEKVFPNKKSGILEEVRLRQEAAAEKENWDHNGVAKEYDSYEDYKKDHPEDYPTDTQTPLIIIPKIMEPRASVAENLDFEAGMTLQALGESSAEAYPDDIFSEAENVGNTIRIAAETAIMEQLKKAEQVAATEGKVMSIPFYFTRIDDEMRKVKQRFEQLAHIVKAAQIKEGTEDWERRGFMNG